MTRSGSLTRLRVAAAATFLFLGICVVGYSVLRDDPPSTQTSGASAPTSESLPNSPTPSGDGDHGGQDPEALRVSGPTRVLLDKEVAAATASVPWRTVDQAMRAGFHDDPEEPGPLFHLYRPDLIDGKFEPTRPEMLLANRETGQILLTFRTSRGSFAPPSVVVVDDLEGEGFELSDEVFEFAGVVEPGLVVA